MTFLVRKTRKVLDTQGEQVTLLYNLLQSHILSLLCFINCNTFWHNILAWCLRNYTHKPLFLLPCHFPSNIVPACPCPSRGCGVTERKPVWTQRTIGKIDFADLRLFSARGLVIFTLRDLGRRFLIKRNRFLIK